MSPKKKNGKKNDKHDKPKHKLKRKHKHKCAAKCNFAKLPSKCAKCFPLRNAGYEDFSCTAYVIRDESENGKFTGVELIFWLLESDWEKIFKRSPFVKRLNICGDDVSDEANHCNKHPCLDSGCCLHIQPFGSKCDGCEVLLGKKWQIAKARGHTIFGEDRGYIKASLRILPPDWSKFLASRLYAYILHSGLRLPGKISEYGVPVRPRYSVWYMIRSYKQVSKMRPK